MDLDFLLDIKVDPVGLTTERVTPQSRKFATQPSYWIEVEI